MTGTKPAHCANCESSYNPARGVCPRCHVFAKRRRSAAAQLTEEGRLEHEKMVGRARLGARVLYCLGATALLAGVGELMMVPAGALPVPAAALAAFGVGAVALMKGHLLAWRADSLELQVVRT
ncbi:MAG: hypothetical protein ACAI25_17685 [Planctomycetota bacterium]